MSENSSHLNGECTDYKNAIINGIYSLSNKVERAECFDKAIHSSYKYTKQSKDVTESNDLKNKHQQKSSATFETINGRFERLFQRLELCKTLLSEERDSSSDSIASAKNIKPYSKPNTKLDIVVGDSNRCKPEESTYENDSSTLLKLEKVSLEPKLEATNLENDTLKPVLSDALFIREPSGLCPDCTFARINDPDKSYCEKCIQIQRPILDSCNSSNNDKGYLWWYVIPIEGTDIKIVRYANERLMDPIMRLITKDLSEPYSIYTYRYFIDTWPHLCFVALAGEQCVGAIVCKLSLHGRDTRRGYIAMLAVDENFRRQKIGTHLVTHAIEAMIKEGCDEVVLETEVTNKSAMKLYENLGFVRDKRLFRYYLNDVDAFRLKLWLKSTDRSAYY